MISVITNINVIIITISLRGRLNYDFSNKRPFKQNRPVFKTINVDSQCQSNVDSQCQSNVDKLLPDTMAGYATGHLLVARPMLVVGYIQGAAFQQFALHNLASKFPFAKWRKGAQQITGPWIWIFSFPSLTQGIKSCSMRHPVHQFFTCTDTGRVPLLPLTSSARKTIRLGVK